MRHEVPARMIQKPNFFRLSRLSSLLKNKNFILEPDIFKSS